MIKVLILAYDFPPYISVGALRPYSWYKYLMEFGIYPIVVTRLWQKSHNNSLDYFTPTESSRVIEETKFGVIIKAPYNLNLRDKIVLKYGESRFILIRRLISGFYEVAQFIANIGPKSKLFYEAREYLKKHQVDLIIATGEPFVLFKYAYKLSKDFNIPWIADYRDPWSQDKARNGKRLSKKWDALLEKKFCSGADAVVTVSAFFKKKIESLIKRTDIHIVTNGYDPEAIKKASEIKQNNNELRIAFVGTIYKWHPLDRFLSACREFVIQHQNPKFRIEFYGVNTEFEIKNLVNSKYTELAPFVSIIPKLQNDELLQNLATANVYLLFNYYAYIGTKIYDYIALRRQIILCFSNDEEANKLKKRYYNMEDLETEPGRMQEELITETNSGIIVKDVTHLKNVLRNLYAEFLNKGYIECKAVNTEQYSRKTQTRNLSRIIESVVDQRLVSG